MTTLPQKNLILIAVLYQLLLVIGDPILLVRFKMSDEFLGQSVLGTIFVGHGVDGNLILDDIHECGVELQMGHIQVIF